MDEFLRAGFSEDQLNGMSFGALTALSKSFAPEPTIVSPANSVIKGTKTLNGSSEEILAGKNSEALLKDIGTNGNLKEGLRFASTQPNGHQPSQNGATAVMSSLSAPAEGVTPIAIIGMSCRFPGEASDIGKLWKLVSEGRSAWSKIPESRFNVDAFYHPDPNRTDTVSPRWCLAWYDKEKVG